MLNLSCERHALEPRVWSVISLLPVIEGLCNITLDQSDHWLHYSLPVFPAGAQRRESIYEGKRLCLRLGRFTSCICKHIETLTDVLA